MSSDNPYAKGKEVSGAIVFHTLDEEDIYDKTQRLIKEESKAK
jgi:hypothetical protein